MRLISVSANHPRLLDLQPFLQNFADHSNGKWTLPGLLGDLERRRIQAWAAQDEQGAFQACALTEVVSVHTGNWLCIIAGGNAGDRAPREEWQHLVLELAEAARKAGFSGFEMIARPGWARVLRGCLQETHRLLEVKF